MLAALDATAADAALGRAVISVVRLRAHLAALPDPALSDFASSQVCHSALNRPAPTRPCTPQKLHIAVLKLSGTSQCYVRNGMSSNPLLFSADTRVQQGCTHSRCTSSSGLPLASKAQLGAGEAV